MYVEYHELLRKYKKAESAFYDALDRRSELVSRVSVQAVTIKEDVVQSNSVIHDENLANYSDRIELVDDLINSTRNTKDMLYHELKQKEKELRTSSDIYDRIYVYKFIDRKKVKQFYMLINYSIRQTNRKIEEIENSLYPGLEEEREKFRKYIKNRKDNEKKKHDKMFKK